VRVEGLVSQLLAFGRRQILYSEQVELNSAVQEITDVLTSVAGERVELAFEPHAAPLYVITDRAQLEHIIVEIVVNARSAMPGGGKIRIRAGREDCHTGSWATLTVEDTGCGISADTVERIFEPFFTTGNDGQTAGLGLSVAHETLRQSGGFINVASTPGIGSTFVLRLPAAGPPEVQRPLRDRAEDEQTTVLVVEDEPALRELVEEVLSDAGFCVIAAANAHDAVQMSERHTVDLLLTDVVMPGESGAWVAKRVVERHPSAAVLYMSGYNDDELVSRGLQSGEAALLPKPFNAATLERAVRRSLERSPVCCA
jgi:two-component system, cell cycle sensor histidine kinase and response regulator CckA